MRVARRLLLGLALALLLLVLGDAALWDGWPGPVVAHTWECIEKLRTLFADVPFGEHPLRFLLLLCRVSQVHQR